MNRGYDALIIYDDLSEHAVAYRQMSLLLRRPPGREAFPGDVFYLHSRLLERASQMSFFYGGGSLTALPIVETKGGDISAYIPTNIISITDGQLFLAASLVNKGIRPAIDLQLSVSRVGSAAQFKSMAFVSKKIKYCLSMFHLYEASEKLGAVNDHITPLINRGRRVYNFFTQPVYETVDFYKQIICLFCIGEGYADKIQMEHLDLFFKMMFDVSLTKFYLTSDKSLFLNTGILNSTFINYDFEYIKPILSNFCENYSQFFTFYIVKVLTQNNGDDIRYKELLATVEKKSN
jgi:F-type H+/Na+-transporting ATPase subunit alpha